MIMKNKIYACLLVSLGMLLLSACYVSNMVDNMVSIDEMIGVWHTDNAGQHVAYGSSAEIHITDDGNLYVLITSNTTAGNMTDTFHYHHEFVDGQFLLTPVEHDGPPDSYYMEKVYIEVAGNEIHLDMGHVMWWRNPENALYTLYKVLDEVPYGWTDIHRQEIEALNMRMIQEIHVFTQRFSQALGIPIQPYLEFVNYVVII
jgi:hypothetical protein